MRVAFTICYNLLSRDNPLVDAMDDLDQSVSAPFWLWFADYTVFTHQVNELFTHRTLTLLPPGDSHATHSASRS